MNLIMGFLFFVVGIGTYVGPTVLGLIFEAFHQDFVMPMLVSGGFFASGGALIFGAYFLTKCKNKN